MQRTTQKFTGSDIFKQMKNEEYVYRPGLSATESFAFGYQMSVEGYHAYGYTSDGRELRTVAPRVERP